MAASEEDLSSFVTSMLSRVRESGGTLNLEDRNRELHGNFNAHNDREDCIRAQAGIFNSGIGIPPRGAGNVGDLYIDNNDGSQWARISDDVPIYNQSGNIDIDDLIADNEELVDDNVLLENLNAKLYAALEYAFTLDSTGNLERSIKNEKQFKELFIK